MNPVSPKFAALSTVARWLVSHGALTVIVLTFVGRVLLCTAVFAQSPLSTGDAKGSVLLNSGAFIQFEVADKAVKTSYQYEHATYTGRKSRANPDHPIRMVPRAGASLRAAVDNNRGTIFSKDQVAVGGELALNGGWSNLVSHRQSRREQRFQGPLTVIIRDILENQGKKRPSLKLLHDTLTHVATLLENARNKIASDSDKELKEALDEQKAAEATATEAAKALEHGSEKPTAEADKVKLRTDYEQALIASRAATARLERIAKARGDSLKKVLNIFELRRRDYESLHPEFASAIRTQYPSVKKTIEDRFPDLFEKTQRSHPVLTTAQPAAGPLTTEERFVLDYVLNGLPEPTDDAAQKMRKQDVARILRYLTARGPGSVMFDQIDLRIGISRNQYKILAPDAAFASQVRTEKPVALSAILSYSIELAGRPGGGGWPRIFGIALGAEQRNNAGSLASIDLRDVVFSSGDGTSTIRTGETVQKVLRGSYERYRAFIASTDFVIYPPFFKNRIAVNGFSRYETGGGGVDGGLTPGIGALLVQEGAPRKVNGGVSLYWENTKSAKADLIIGFNF